MAERLRILLDTNVYGFLLEARHERLFSMVKGSQRAVYYGFDVIRQELRAIPGRLRHARRSYRMAALTAYDGLVGNHLYHTTSIIEAIAIAYLDAYKGGISKHELWHDFLIVACASIHRLDMVVTEDRHSMLSAAALKAYAKVNADNDLPVPVFHSMSELMRLL